MNGAEFIIVVGCIIASYGIGYALGKGVGALELWKKFKDRVLKGDENAHS